MTSPATTRYTLDPAPDGLSLPQDFLNTRGVGGEADLLADVPTAMAWISEALADGVKLSASDLERLRAFRAELHRLVTPDAGQPQPVGENGAADTATPLTAANPAAASGWSVGAELLLGVDGVVELRPGGSGAEYVVSRVLAEVLAGQQVDGWRRVKACRNPRCAVVFYDRSRNNSGVWHSLKTCGNPANLRAFRARNKEASG
jgi:CGNR zinc finger protein/putative stress-induced transcription regulator